MNRVENIKQGNYTGYFWRSDAKAPEIVQGAFPENLDSGNNPFIIEAQLYDENTMLSYSIKYVDGKYWIFEHQVKPTDFNMKDVKQVTFYTHRIKEHKRLQFLQYWKETKNEQCEDMHVLQPEEFVFVGFNDKEE